ncbi:Uncharacterized protein DBV15_00570 [Temnothorax longispinosus]|uniref:Uncharacterized protein n=1 Tax=Temnothorax longispinosus TaxID=300112 RepID=A0A4S2KXH5_9HYME|nr:Uncharacterized protein DBV15_00570 [Temnothorax longispinosus]
MQTGPHCDASLHGFHESRGVNKQSPRLHLITGSPPAFGRLIAGHFLSFLSSVIEHRDGNNVPIKTRFKNGHVRSRLLDWTKALECAKFGVNATLATAKACTN